MLGCKESQESKLSDAEIEWYDGLVLR